jgi:hypothetical protein
VIAYERLLVLRFDQRVHVIPLNADVDDPEALAPSRRQRRFAYRVIHAATAQVTNRIYSPQRDMHWIPRVQIRPRLVWRARTRPVRRPAGTTTLASTLFEQHQLFGLGDTLAR